MEESISKQGMLYLQQQRFGKKWKRVWCVLYRESSCSISRLEFFECKDGGSVEKNDKCLRKQQEHKKVIRLVDCIRVSEVEMDGCPRDTGPFLIETTEKIYMFAADRQQLDDWTHKLCEIAFPMSRMEHKLKRGSLQRRNRPDEDEGMEDNSLYSGRETVRDFRVCVRRTDASDRCRLKGDGVLRADVDALLLIDHTGDVVFTWPYKYLRRFGRDKSTFSFEAGRRCDSGEGSFEFDTKQGNVLFQAVEAAINLKRISVPQRQPSGGSPVTPETPQDLNLPCLPLILPTIQSRVLPQPRSHIPQTPSAQTTDGVYSVVTEPPHHHVIHHKESSTSSQHQQQHRPLLSRLEPPIDKTLTAVKSLTLDTRGIPVPRKNQVKMISSCPLPHASPDPGPHIGLGPAPNPSHSPKLSPNLDKMYSQITEAPTEERTAKREKRGGAGTLSCTPGAIPQEPEYSLPFDTLATSVMVNILNSHQALVTESDPLYDSIDEMKIGNIEATYGKVDPIYDEPEGCAAAAATATTAQTPPTYLYDNPEEVRGDAWRIMGTTADPKGHEYPFNPRVDDYAVPKRPQRVFPATQNTNEEEDREEEPREEEEEQMEDSPYKNVTVKMIEETFD
ncbi:docking protein 2 [Antennarius striatus]|uniref:docking protein 2 n=1 Tax=Antennarius striatus TaxID=241820 RepID=UPI0035ADFA67